MIKTIVITGATSGIGYEAAKAFAKEGHRVIFLARNLSVAPIIKLELQQTTKSISDFVVCDLSSFESIKLASKLLLERYPVIDVLVNNAGVWEMGLKESLDGIEMNFAVNHLAPFLLTKLLLPSLKKSEEGRIVNTSSMAHRRNILDFDDIEFKKQPYNGIATYSQSKLCNILFTLQLQNELIGTNITANTVHPGYVKTNLFNNMGNLDWSNVPDASDGARSTIFASLSPVLKGLSGKYFYQEREDDCSELAKDKNVAKKLWDLSLNYVKDYLN